MATATKAKKAQAKPKVLNVALVWDMSGSMATVEGATREGIQGYLLDLQNEETSLRAEHGDGVYTRVSITTFDTLFERWEIDTPVNDLNVQKLVGKWRPRGMTALYDAIANTIVDLKVTERSDEKFLIVIMTDGQENSSKEYSLAADGRKRLFDLVKSLEAKGNVTFVYLGANSDAYADAQAIGLAAGTAAQYSSTPGSMSNVTASAGQVTHAMRHSPQASTQTPFADAGLGQDYSDTSSASEDTRKAR